MDDVMKWIMLHEPVLSFGNLSVAGKCCIMRLAGRGGCKGAGGRGPSPFKSLAPK